MHETSTSLRMRMLTLLVVSVTPLFAQQALPDPPAPASFRTVRVTNPPKIDGDLNDSAWLAAPEITTFTQYDPDNGKPATQNSVVKVVYDDDAIYFAARMDDTHPVTARLGRRDSTLQSDYFRVQIDAHHDRRSGNSFLVYPSNVQQDSALYNDTAEDLDWDGVWTSSTKVTSTGWTAELRIPYSQLRFPDRPLHVWGINFYRRIVRNREQDRLVNTPKSENGNVSRFADLTGIEGIRPRKKLEILPYVVSRSRLDNTILGEDPLNSTQEFGGNLGLDVKYGLTSNLTLTGTINPDFGQVEVDPARLNLSEFELFFPEKRPFFVEGSNLFNGFGRLGTNNRTSFNFLPPEYFYSRRIGRSPQGTGRLDYDYIDVPTESSILGAVKLSGKTGNGWSIGLLDALTNREQASFVLGNQRNSQVVEPMTNYFVGRVIKDVGKNAGFGAFLTSVKRSLPDSLTYLRESAWSGGVDGYKFFGNKDYVFQWSLGGSHVTGSADSIFNTQRSSARYFQRPDARSFELDNERSSLSGYSARTTFTKQTGLWRYSGMASTYSPGFEVNDIGFMQRSDITATHATATYVNQSVTKRFRERVFFFGKFQNWNYDGDLLANGIYTEANAQFAGYNGAFSSWGVSGRRINDRSTRGGPVTRTPGDIFNTIGYYTDSRKKVSVEIFQQNYWDERGGYDHSGGFTLTYRPRNNISVQLIPFFGRTHDFAQYVKTEQDPAAEQTFGRRFVFANLEQRTLEIGTRLDWTFTSNISAQLYLQPFIATGDYRDYKSLERPRTDHYTPYGGAVSEPDFNIRSVRGSAVLRWQFLPGSTMYFVWNENRFEALPFGDFSAQRDLRAIGNIPSDDIFLLKVSYLVPFRG